VNLDSADKIVAIDLKSLSRFKVCDPKNFQVTLAQEVISAIEINFLGVLYLKIF
jgi:hypothetical protein